MKRITSFRTVALVWVVMCVVGALPYILSGTLSVIDALFESVSGFTTTGLTVILSPESLPKGLLFWRAFTHWVGGMGVLALLFALLPYLEGHPAQLMLTEIPGPVKGKLVSKTSDTARILYSIYFAITAVLFLLLLSGGMSVFDAAVHTFSTVGTGGFSSRNSSISSYNNNTYLEIVITIFMLLSSVNFNLYYLIFIRKLKDALKSEELRWLFIIFGASVVIIAISVLPRYGNFGNALKDAAFHSASLVSTTGYYTTDFTKWPMLAQTIIILLMFIGGSSGSTAGGLKISRVILLIKNSIRGVKRILSPNLVDVVRLDTKPVEETAIRTTQTYFSVYILVLVISTFLLSFDRYNFETNFLSTISAFNNIGLSWGEIGYAGSFSGFSVFSKLVLMADMLLGRLEIFPILLAFAITRKKRSGKDTHRGISR